MFFVCILHKFAYSETKQDGLEFQILGTIWLLDFPDLTRLIPMSFLSVLSVFVDFPFWMRLGVRYHCYYLYSVGRVMDNATVSSLYCIALYDNYIALNDKVQKWRNFSKNC
jgi:hypothetical protein